MTTDAQAGWQPDPTSRHHLRYWDGGRWTDHVADHGVQTVDPLVPQPKMESTTPSLAEVEVWARRYLASCTAVVEATQACGEVSNRAVGAREVAARRPQHELSIANFTQVAEQAEHQFADAYRRFVEVGDAARAVAANLLLAKSPVDHEIILIDAGAENFAGYNDAGVANHILRTEFGPSPVAFLRGVEATNTAIQSDTAGYGEPGFIGYIYRPR